ncbi:RAMP superfamily CRISPR-associated protein [Paenibacillus chartarius]|uniref:RAMP superfamily CRISPR-associated protein n=1 Tax=Paenibacillus chartarius TaxID=747481 RepID=A0ABV6DTK4_9BACL
MTWCIRIALLSEAALGSGQAMAGETDTELTYDEHGIPYYKGKTLKGKLREQAELVGQLYGETATVERLFGSSTSRSSMQEGRLRFGNAYLPYEWYRELAHFRHDEIKARLTAVRIIASLHPETGTMIQNSSRQVRVLTKDAVFYSQLHGMERLQEEEIAFMALVISMTKHIGSMQSRGKGHVWMQLYENDQNVTPYYMNKIKLGAGS